MTEKREQCYNQPKEIDPMVLYCQIPMKVSVRRSQADIHLLAKEPAINTKINGLLVYVCVYVVVIKAALKVQCVICVVFSGL